MKITLNGQIKEIPSAMDLKTLIEEFCKNSQHVIAEHNGMIIKNEQWETRSIAENDVLELITLVGGG